MDCRQFVKLVFVVLVVASHVGKKGFVFLINFLGFRLTFYPIENLTWPFLTAVLGCKEDAQSSQIIPYYSNVKLNKLLPRKLY